MEEMKTLVENEEVMESVVEEVGNSVSKSNTVNGVMIGVGIAAVTMAAAYVTPKIMKFACKKIEERRNKKLEEDYIAEELNEEIYDQEQDNE